MSRVLRKKRSEVIASDPIRSEYNLRSSKMKTSGGQNATNNGPQGQTTGDPSLAQLNADLSAEKDEMNEFGGGGAEEGSSSEEDEDEDEEEEDEEETEQDDDGMEQVCINSKDKQNGNEGVENFGSTLTGAGAKMNPAKFQNFQRRVETFARPGPRPGPGRGRDPISALICIHL